MALVPLREMSAAIMETKMERPRCPVECIVASLEQAEAWAQEAAEANLTFRETARAAKIFGLPIIYAPVPNPIIGLAVTAAKET